RSSPAVGGQTCRAVCTVRGRRGGSGLGSGRRGGAGGGAPLSGAPNAQGGGCGRPAHAVGAGGGGGRGWGGGAGGGGGGGGGGGVGRGQLRGHLTKSQRRATRARW